MKHGLREPTGKGILLAGMVGTNEVDAIQVVALAMSEFRLGRRDPQADFPPGFEIGRKGQLPQRHNDPNLFQQLDFTQ